MLGRRRRKRGFYLSHALTPGHFLSSAFIGSGPSSWSAVIVEACKANWCREDLSQEMRDWTSSGAHTGSGGEFGDSARR